MNPLTELAEYEELNRDLNRGKGPVQISGCMDSQKVHLMWEAGETLPWKLVVTYDDSRAKEIYEDFRCFTDAVWLYPAKDLLFYNADIHGNLIIDSTLTYFSSVAGIGMGLLNIAAGVGTVYLGMKSGS